MNRKDLRDEIAERGLISQVYHDPSVIDTYGLTSDHFVDHRYRQVFNAIKAIHARGEAHTVDLRLHDELQALGWTFAEIQACIQEFFDSCDGPSMRVAEFAKACNESLRRRSIVLAAALVSKGEFAKAEELLDKTVDNVTASSGLFVDLGPVLDDDLSPEEPAVGLIDGGKALLYAGRINEIHGEPGLGKTNVLLIVAVQILQNGGRIVFIDPEDNEKAFCLRLLAFGASPDAIRERAKYLRDPSPDQLRQAARWCTENTCSAVFADGLAAMLTAQQLDEDKPSDVLSFFRRCIRPFANAGPAVIVSDHVAKDKDGRGRWPRGSGAKLGEYDGAVYQLKKGKPYDRERAGFVRLTVAKDRNGGVGGVGTVAAEIHFSPNESGTSVSIIQPQSKDEFRPTALMENVVTAIEENPEINRRGLNRLGKNESVGDAIEALMRDGYLRLISGGPGKSNKYTILKRYRSAEA